MSQENYMLSVYNPATRQAESIAVSEALYNEYRRGKWRMDNNDDSFNDHETAFTALKGGQDGAYENFDEFRSDQNNPEKLVIEALARQDLLQAFAFLTEDERKLFHALFLEEKSERQAARELGLPQRTLHDRKVNLLRKVKKLADFQK